MAAIDGTDEARRAFAEALAQDPDCLVTLERYAEWQLSQAEDGQDFQMVIDLTTHGIRLDPDNIKLHI
jgi:cytochrome c-type biogenesis protein CcmH/NrfG